MAERADPKHRRIHLELAHLHEARVSLYEIEGEPDGDGPLTIANKTIAIRGR